MSKYLFIPNNKRMIKTISNNGFNSFILPLENYSIGFDNYYSVKDINRLSKKYEVSIIINKFLHKKDLENINNILENIKNIKGYFIEDLSLLNILPKNKIIINQNHIINNYKSINMYNSLGYKNVVISNELTLEEIKEIRKNTKSKLFYFYINKNTLLYSKRTLITNYNKNFKKLNIKKRINVKESVTKHKLQIKEEKNSTLIFNEEIFNASKYKEKLNINIDYLIINLNNLTNQEIKKIKDLKHFGECNFLEEKIGYKVKEEKK